jgi:hypothetical protein
MTSFFIREYKLVGLLGSRFSLLNNHNFFIQTKNYKLWHYSLLIIYKEYLLENIN